MRLQHLGRHGAQAHFVQRALDHHRQRERLQRGAAVHGEHGALLGAQRQRRLEILEPVFHAQALPTASAARSVERSNIAPMATTILRGPSYGSRACAASMLSSITTSPWRQSKRTAQAS
ncbi:hypothetical protein FQZ97_652570 [compost metagenome]